MIADGIIGALSSGTLKWIWISEISEEIPKKISGEIVLGIPGGISDSFRRTTQNSSKKNS